MNHNYKITDFKKMGGESDTDIRDIHVFMELANLSGLPSIIKMRIEDIANNLISDYEQKNNTTLLLDDMELGACIEIRKDIGELVINVYIGYSLECDCLHAEQLIKKDDIHYAFIRKYYFDMLNEYVNDEIRKLEECLC